MMYLFHQKISVTSNLKQIMWSIGSLEPESIMRSKSWIHFCIEKYRPKTAKDCILPKKLKDTFQEFVKDKHIPNLILSPVLELAKQLLQKM